jgi:MYXO-CTERM domain-containing protein
MPRVIYARPIGLVAIVLLAALAMARPARASNPCSTYVVPSLVELQPSADAATRVVIHGAFFQLTSDTTMSYGTPRCGVMYFDCVAGQETMCQMQWNELRNAVSATAAVCEGFGSWNVLSVATIRDEGAPLGTPDAWDLGMGISPGSYVDNKCPPARQLICPVPASDGGADASPVDDAAPAMDVAPPTDRQPPGDDGPSAPTDAQSADNDGAAPPMDARADGGADARTTVAPSTGWCAVADPAPAPGRVGALVLAALVLGRRRRRDRG